VTTDLGTLGGRFSVALAINRRGQVVGTSRTADGETHVFLWQNGKMADLGRYGWDKAGGPGVMIDDRGDVVWNEKGRGAVVWDSGRVTRLAGTAYAIDGRGQVLGGIADSSAFLWENGTTTALPDAQSSDYVAVNDRGQVAGTSRAGGMESAFLWENGKTRPLGVLPGFEESTAVALNDDGDVLGYCFTDTPFRLHTFLWHDGKMSDVDPDGPDWVFPVALNDRDAVVVRTAVGSSRHELLWEDGLMHDLGSTGYSAASVDERGQVAATMLTQDRRLRAFVWASGVAGDLSGGRWSYATGSNDRGQVVGARGTGQTFNGNRVVHAVLWTPRPG
jgi:probable HAF family extracellular repeat protein